MMLKGKKLPFRYALFITCIWEIIFISFIYFYGDLIGVERTYYGHYLEFPLGIAIWTIVIAVFGGLLPFCFTDYFK